MHQHPIKAVISDWCGTLESNVQPRITIIEKTCKAMGLATITANMQREIAGMTQAQLIATISKLNPDKTIDKSAFQEHYATLAKEAGYQLIITPSTLAWLKSHICFCLFTNGSHAYVSHNLEKYQLRDSFQAIATADDYPAKPSPAMLQAMLAKINIPAENCLAVGDHPYDYLAAKAAGIACVIVDTGIATKKDFADLGEPLAFCESINDLPDIIQAINAQHTA